MDIEKELKELSQNYTIEKKLDEIKSLLVKKDLEQCSSSSSFGLWAFALLALFGAGGFNNTPMPSITNIYTDTKREDKE